MKDCSQYIHCWWLMQDFDTLLAHQKLHFYNLQQFSSGEFYCHIVISIANNNIFFSWHLVMVIMLVAESKLYLCWILPFSVPTGMPPDESEPLHWSSVSLVGNKHYNSHSCSTTVILSGHSQRTISDDLLHNWEILPLLWGVATIGEGRPKLSLACQDYIFRACFFSNFYSFLLAFFCP